MSAARMAATKAERKVLILGAGYVSAPVVDYLSRDHNVQVTVASEFKAEIDKLHCKFPCITPELLEIHRSQDELEKLITSHDLVISLLPYSLHPDVAKLCIKLKTNMVTASYRSPAMLDLHNAAVDAGITILNEVGVDPGIDHMLALECFDEIKAHGGKVTSFVSWCGGVPAPEDADNPLRYKFSWSPRGVLLNTMSDAKYLQDGEVLEISPNGGLLDHVQTMDFLPGFNLEGIPNRDSTVYSDLYGIQSAHTILRGTLRYKGFCDAMKGILSLGLINPNEHPLLHPSGPDITWRELMCDLLGQKRDIFIDTLKDLVLEKVGGVESRLKAIVDLGLLEDEEIVKRGSILDSLSEYLAKTLNYESEERDLIIMRHEVGVQWPDRSEEVREIDLVVYGNPKKYSAMASTVGYPTGIAAKMILQGEIQSKGVILPFGADIYRPMLQRLQQEGIRARENVVTTRQAHPKGEENIRL